MRVQLLMVDGLSLGTICLNSSNIKAVASRTVFCTFTEAVVKFS